MAISPQRLTIYLYSAHRAVIFAIAQLSCFYIQCCLCMFTRRTCRLCTELYCMFVYALHFYWELCKSLSWAAFVSLE